MSTNRSSRRPRCDISLACLPRHPAMAYLFLVGLQRKNTPTMLATYMAAVEAALLHTAQIPANAGHPLHKGTPREAFIRQFLADHLSEELAIGQGEIISADSQPSEVRNQFDIVLYKRHFPKLPFGGGVNAFLAESVVATIEVKSTLTKKDL